MIWDSNGWKGGALHALPLLPFLFSEGQHSPATRQRNNWAPQTSQADSARIATQATHHQHDQQNTEHGAPPVKSIEMFCSSCNRPQKINHSCRYLELNNHCFDWKGPSFGGFFSPKIEDKEVPSKYINPMDPIMGNLSRTFGTTKKAVVKESPRNLNVRMSLNGENIKKTPRLGR